MSSSDSDLFKSDIVPPKAGDSDAYAGVPLAETIRPKTLNAIIGQADLLGKQGALRIMLEADALSSLIFWGPPGVGKTTLARLLADHIDGTFTQISAVFSGVADLKKVFDAAILRKENGKKTVLFVDEIHRFNKAQQDSFLPYVENGTIILIGATTENPSFELNAALLSRTQVMVLHRLSLADLELIAQRAEAAKGRKLPLDPAARAHLLEMADGDGRALLNLAEQCFGWADKKKVGQEELAKRLMRRAPLYDKSGEEHYNLISALHKSVRGSDPDAALYWFARMLNGGEDPRYLARRITRMAIEDIGLADPAAQSLCLEAWQTFERLGSPEGELALGQAVLYLALAPKSNASYVAYKAAMAEAKKTGSNPPPKHIRNAATKMMKEMGYGAGYEYCHDSPDAFSGQNYFPDGMARGIYYLPVERGTEREMKKRVDYFAKLRAARDKTTGNATSGKTKGSK